MVQHFKRVGHSPAIVTDLYDDGKSRWGRPVLLFLVILLFASVLLYSYNRGKNAIEGTVVATIAPDTPYTRIKPEDPEGMEIAHQDMEIYSRVNDTEEAEVVMQQTAEATDAETIVVDDTVPPYPPTRLAKNTSRGSRILASAIADLEEVSTKKSQQQAALDKKIVEVADAKPVADKPEKKTVVADILATNPLGNNNGPFLLQLASYGSEAAAQTSWNSLKRQHTALGKLSPRIEKISISGKGQFHRLQAGSWKDRNAADMACATLKSGGQDCIVVRR